MKLIECQKTEENVIGEVKVKVDVRVAASAQESLVRDRKEEAQQ